MLKIKACGPSVYTVDHSDSMVCSFVENSSEMRLVSEEEESRNLNKFCFDLFFYLFLNFAGLNNNDYAYFLLLFQ